MAMSTHRASQGMYQRFWLIFGMRSASHVSQLLNAQDAANTRASVKPKKNQITHLMACQRPQRLNMR